MLHIENEGLKLHAIRFLIWSKNIFHNMSNLLFRHYILSFTYTISFFGLLAGR